MQVIRFIPAGKLLTTVHDAGAWYNWAAPQADRFSVSVFSANYELWKTVCSPAMEDLLLAPLAAEERGKVLASWGGAGLDLRAAAAKAAAALDGLRAPAPPDRLGAYEAQAADLAAYLSLLNKVQRSLEFTVQLPPRSREADYSFSGKLAEYALRRDTLLRRLTEASLAGLRVEDGGAVLMSVKSHLELLAAMTAAAVIKERFPRAHVCLAEHRYEYFALDLYMRELKASGSLLRVFDSVLEQGHGGQSVIAAVLGRLAAGEKVAGFVSSSDFRELPNPYAAVRLPPQLPPSFSPEPVLWTRLSVAGCYWGKCAFCGQAHQGDPGVPLSAFDADASAAYVARCARAGYRKFCFSDEAVSGENLRDFCLKLLEAGLDIRWSCRCRCDMTVPEGLFELMRRAGCREILFGVEAASERVQRLMRKYEGSVPVARMESLFAQVAAAGIGLHLSFMGGFPGETPEEHRATVDLVRRTVAGMDNGTYVYNQFEVLAGSRMFRDPEKFGISVDPAPGDIPLAWAYKPLPEIAQATLETNAQLPELRAGLGEALGWGRPAADSAGAVLRYLYFSSGHGLLFKSMDDNPYANPLRRYAGTVFGPGRGAAAAA